MLGEDEKVKFHERLKRERLKRGLTQEQTAAKLNIKRSTYAKYEVGENRPDYELLGKISKLFNKTIDDLLGIEHDENLKNKNPFNALYEINKHLEMLGIDSIGFFDIDEWKNLDPNDVSEIKSHFEWIVHKAKDRKKTQNIEVD